MAATIMTADRLAALEPGELLVRIVRDGWTIPPDHIAELAVFLVPARTNTAWFHRALELGAKPRFFRKRPVFVGAPHNCPVDCLLLIFKQKKVRRG